MEARAKKAKPTGRIDPMAEPFTMTYRRSIDILAHAGIGINDKDLVAPILVAGVIWNGWKRDEWCRDLIREIPEKEDDAMGEPTRFEMFVNDLDKRVKGLVLAAERRRKAFQMRKNIPEDLETAIDLLATNPAAYGFPEESGDLPECEDGFVGGLVRTVNIKEGMTRKGGVNPPSAMPRPPEPPKSFDPNWKTPATRELEGPS